MSRSYKLLLFYALLLLAAFDLQALSQRIFLAAPDPVNWAKVILSVALQATAVAGSVLYLNWLSRTGISLLERSPNLFSRGLKTLPLLASGLLAAFSVTVMYNAVNCGNHPLPTNRGMLTCPR
jgi:hypothetical protein